MHERRRSRLIEAVMRCEIQVNRAHEIVRAHEVVFLVPQQVAKIDRPELPERDHAADRLAVVIGGTVVLFLEVGAGRVRLSAAGQRRLDRGARGGDDPPVDAGYGKLVSRLRDGVLRLGPELGVGRLEAGNLLAFLDARPVIDVVLDRDALGELLQAADVIDVVVRRDEVVDLLDAGFRKYRHDAIGVARHRVGRIDQHRFTRRRDDERRLAAFDVEGVDVECLCRLGCLGLRDGS